MACATQRRTGQPDADEARQRPRLQLPVLRSSAYAQPVWAMLNEEAAEGTGDSTNFSDDLANFLTFKELPPPKDSVSELLIQSPDGKVETGDVWALINFGEEPVLLTWPQLQLRLGPAEGCRMTAGLPPNVVPPPKDELNVLLAIRLGPA